jgi:hypothetical protein
LQRSGPAPPFAGIVAFSSVLSENNYGKTQFGRDWITRIIFFRADHFSSPVPIESEPGSDFLF